MKASDSASAVAYQNLGSSGGRAFVTGGAYGVFCAQIPMSVRVSGNRVLAGVVLTELLIPGQTS